MSIVSIVQPFLGLIDTYLIAPLVRQLKYLRNFKDNVDELQSAVKDLQARRNAEQSDLKAEENAGGVKTDAASNWFEAVAKIEEEAANIEEEGGRGCISMNCWSRYKLSKRSVDLALKAKERQGEEIVLTRQPSLKIVVEMPIEVITTENQQLTQFVLKQILDCIHDPETGIIGVCGMGGVGKSYLVKQVNNHLINKNPCFQAVIMVTVSATPTVTSIQTSIGKRLGLDLSSEGDATEKLFEALGRKKFLLILDDVWPKSEFKIGDVGIPHPRKHKRGSKILVVSRSEDACTNMGAKKIIKMQPLSAEESWNLFVEKAGQHVADGAEIEEYARKIVQECKGLPLAIVTVARAMANRRLRGSWKLP